MWQEVSQTTYKHKRLRAHVHYRLLQQLMAHAYQPIAMCTRVPDIPDTKLSKQASSELQLPSTVLAV